MLRNTSPISEATVVNYCKALSNVIGYQLVTMTGGPVAPALATPVFNGKVQNFTSVQN